jgi:hypothetical protein
MAARQASPWKPLGELLVERGLLTVTELDRALEEQTHTGERLGEILVARRIVAGPVLTTLLAEQTGAELETQGGFGSGLFAQIARRNGKAELHVAPPAPPEVTWTEAAAESVHAASMTFDDPAFELSALRAELEMLRSQNAQLEAEISALKKKPAAKRRAPAKPKRAPAKPRAAKPKAS